MRTRLHHWLDQQRMKVLYGVQVFAAGEWRHAHASGKPLIFETEQQAQDERRKLRRRAEPPKETGNG